MSAKNENEVRIERTFAQPASVVFKALSEGRLFHNCGGDLSGTQVDFRSGGKYSVFFSNAEMTCHGKFLEIIPNKKIVFTWGDEGSSAGFPKNTKVSIDLFPEGQKTKLVILHSGFADKEEADAHNGGWCAGLDDLSGELEQGRIRILRLYTCNKEALYKACSDPKKFFGIVAEADQGEANFCVGGQYRFPTEKGEVRGKFEEIIPGQKIVFSWLTGCSGPLKNPSRVTLTFDDEDEGGSSLALVHELLPLEEVQNHREGWSYLMGELKKITA